MAFRNGSRHAAPAGRDCAWIWISWGSTTFGSLASPVLRGNSGSAPGPRIAEAPANPSPRWPWHFAHSLANTLAPGEAWLVARVSSSAVAPVCVVAHPGQERPAASREQSTSEAGRRKAEAEAKAKAKAKGRDDMGANPIRCVRRVVVNSRPARGRVSRDDSVTMR